MKITLDTNFLISATQWDYSVAHKLLKQLIEKDIKLFTTKEILEEFSIVLKKDFKYEQMEINRILDVVNTFTMIIEPKEKLDVIKEDPTDNKILACALESDSEYILTYDNHLLKINEFKGIKILRPEDILDFI